MVPTDTHIMKDPGNQDKSTPVRSAPADFRHIDRISPDSINIGDVLYGWDDMDTCGVVIEKNPKTGAPRIRRFFWGDWAAIEAFSNIRVTK